ncbi:MAG: DUF927 domain-containing protein [Phycisphaerae bacterium]|nr:DUF927 domain-containing protein [Phycisphaerae bacterium]
MAEAFELTADGEMFLEYLQVLFESDQIIQIEVYPKPWGKQYPLKRFTLRRDAARNVVKDMERLNNAPYFGNCYVRINPLRPGHDVRKAAGDADIPAIQVVHLDIDTAEARSLVARFDQMGWPPPHVVVASGGVTRGGKGAQVFWRLSQPFPLVTGIERGWAGRIIRAMLEAVGGDLGTENPSRLMASPGFWNVKEPKRFAPRQVELIICEPENERWTLEQFAQLMEVERELVEKPRPRSKQHGEGLAQLPGDDYNARGDIRPLLEKQGWQLSVEGDNEHWTRPGKDGGTSATFNGQTFFVFSSNAPPFEANQGYSPFAVFALLEADGDYERAAALLRKQGFGSVGGRGGKPRVGPDLEDAKLCLSRLLKEAAAGSAYERITKALGDRAELEALAVVCRDEPGIWTATLMRLEKLPNIRARHVQDFREVVAKAAGRIQQAEDAQARRVEQIGTPVIEAVPKAPIIAAAVVPHKWKLGPAGISVQKSHGEASYFEQFCNTPLMITGRLQDLETNHVCVALAWHYLGRWNYVLVPREVIAQSADIIRVLAALGVDVHGQNKVRVIEYLAMFEAVNGNVLPHGQAVTRMGWFDRPPRFVLGHRIIDAEGISSMAAADPRQWEAKLPVGFRGLGEGDEEILDAYDPRGTLEGWLEAIAPIAHYPRVQLAIYAAMAAPMLRVLRANSFIIEWADQSSSGKTSALMVGASTCGNPNERSPRTLIRPWSATDVWIDRALSIANNAPLFLDDTRKAPDPRKIPQIVYAVTGGQGKGRGAPRGVQATGSWATILLSTGENRISEFGEEHGGTHGRVLSLWGPPWGIKNMETAAVIDRVKIGIEANYGHALPAFLQFLLAHQKQWDEYRRWFLESQAGYVEAYRSTTSGGAVEFAHRLGAYMAVLQVTATLVHEVLPLPWSAPDLWEVLRTSAMEGIQAADRASFALELALEHAVIHGLRYYDKGGGCFNYGEASQREPVQGWAGRWDVSSEHWEYVAFATETLMTLLKPHEISWRIVVRWWNDRGWLLHDKEGKRQIPVYLGSDRPAARLYAVRREAVLSVSPGIEDRGRQARLVNEENKEDSGA